MDVTRRALGTFGSIAPLAVVVDWAINCAAADELLVTLLGCAGLPRLFSADSGGVFFLVFVTYSYSFILRHTRRKALSSGPLNVWPCGKARSGLLMAARSWAPLRLAVRVLLQGLDRQAGFFELLNKQRSLR